MAGADALRGKRVLVTRAADQAGTLTDMLARHGATAIELPVIAIVATKDHANLDAAIAHLSDYHWIIFTSVNGVKYFFERLDEFPAHPPISARLCAIGPATSKAMAVHGMKIDFQPDKHVAEGVVAGLKRLGVSGAKILLPRALEAREIIVEELTAAGAVVDEIPVYETVQPAESAERARELLQGGSIDIVTFTSSSTVRNLIGLLGGDVAALANTTIACIGPITSRTALEHGLRVDVESAEHTIPGLVRAIVAFEKERRV